MARLLTIVQDVADRVGLVRPSSVVGSSDHQTRQLFALANQEGREQARRYRWQALTAERVFTTVASEAQAGALPADFDRFVTGTFYNRTKGRVVSGPLTSQEWADYKGRMTSVVFDAFRVRGDAILIAPAPAAGETMAYEYVSKNWCGGAESTSPDRAAFVSDDDITFLDAEAHTQGIVWRFQRSRGFDYAETFQGYEMLLAQLMGRDGGARTLSMMPMGPRRPNSALPPDGNWNLS